MTQAKILIVDDEEINRVLLKRMLADGPFKLFEACDGQEALDAIERERPDLVLLDVMMPRLSGLEVLKQIKSKEDTRDIVVIMVTALSDDEHVAESLEKGASDHITKPFSKLVVRARVNAALRDRTFAHRQPGKIIGFVGARGGAGTTTVASNVALALQAKEHSAAIIDFRAWMGAVAQQFSTVPTANIAPLLEIQRPGAINARNVAACVTSHVSGVKLMLAPPTMAAEYEIVPDQAVEILDTAARLADYLVVDLPCVPSQSTAAILQRCHFVGLTIPVDAFGVSAAQQWLKAFTAWGISGSLVGAVLVVHHAATGSIVNVRYARERLDCRVVGVIPPARDLCLISIEKGEPIMLSKAKGPEALAFSELAERLVQDPVPGLVF